MKLAILSGTFDPIHNSHLALANFVKNNFSYDEILLIPAYNPPFKNSLASAKDRMSMAKLALRNLDYIKVSDIEYRLKGKSYSVLTVKELIKEYEVEGRIGFVIGTDAYITLEKWYNAEELRALVDFIVFERGVSFDDNRVKLLMDRGFKLIKAEMPYVDISSTEIRKRVKNNQSIAEFVPKLVEEFIKENELYQ